MQNYDKLVKPVFEAAGIESKMLWTRNAQHIYEIVDEENIHGTNKGGGRRPKKSRKPGIFFLCQIFLGSTKHLYNRLCPLVCRSVGLSVTHTYTKTI